VHLAQKYRVRFPCSQQYSLGAFQPICPTVPLQHDASPQPLHIPASVNGEHMGSAKKLAMNNIKRFLMIEAKTKSGKMPKHNSGMD